MSIAIAAKFVNGVFVPESKPPLCENERVNLVVEVTPDLRDVQADLAAVRAQARTRIIIDPEIAQAIAEDPEFNIENW